MGYFLFGLALGIGLTSGTFLSVSDSTLDSPWWTGLAGVTVGACLAALFALVRDIFQRRSEARDVAATIYTELVDRISRCCFDYDIPFRSYSYPPSEGQQNRTRDNIIKFRPTDPVIYPNIGAKLALLPTDARNHVLQFYSSLDRWRREIDYISASAREVYAPSELVRVARRLGETLPFAERALASLSKCVKDAKKIEEDAFAGIYSSAFDERRKRAQEMTLREALSKLRKTADQSKQLESQNSQLDATPRS